MQQKANLPFLRMPAIYNPLLSKQFMCLQSNLDNWVIVELIMSDKAMIRCNYINAINVRGNKTPGFKQQNPRLPRCCRRLGRCAVAGGVMTTSRTTTAMISTGSVG